MFNNINFSMKVKDFVQRSFIFAVLLITTAILYGVYIEIQQNAILTILVTPVLIASYLITLFAMLLSILSIFELIKTVIRKG